MVIRLSVMTVLGLNPRIDPVISSSAVPRAMAGSRPAMTIVIGSRLCLIVNEAIDFAIADQPHAILFDQVIGVAAGCFALLPPTLMTTFVTLVDGARRCGPDWRMRCTSASISHLPAPTPRFSMHCLVCVNLSSISSIAIVRLVVLYRLASDDS
jgi:hypothetical protein